jgi:hypothetical protein
MAENKMNLKGGVLIIGSLLWQDHLDSQNDQIRLSWRTEHLEMENKIPVNVPIRYGRKSQRSGVYTMTFSNSCPVQGSAFFVPFKTMINSFEFLNEKAVALSMAEGMRGNLIGGRQDVWSVVGMLFNPKIDKEIQNEILEQWEGVLINEFTFNPDLFKVGNESTCINKNGILNFAWPTTVTELDAARFNEFDFLLATATKPTDYPDNETLFNNVKDDIARCYFRSNNRAGITTFQDSDILTRLENE